MQMSTVVRGDSREILPALKGKYKDRKIVIITDPPFNIGYHYRSYSDRMADSEYYAMLRDVIGEDSAVIVHYPENLYRLSHEIGRVPERVVSWVYNSNTGRQHRDIAFFGIKPCFKRVVQPYKNPSDKRIMALIAKGRTGGRLYDWWNVNQVKNVSKEKTEHPCMMPLEVMKNIVGVLPDGILVIDPFCGSGTTGVACAESGIDFIGVEIDEHYCQIARERILGAMEGR